MRKRAAGRKKKVSSKPTVGFELVKLVEKFCAKYRNRPMKRCVDAAAELFMHLADHWYDVTAVRRCITVGERLYEHAWVEIEVGGVPFVLDPTGPQQFQGPLISKKDDFFRILALPRKERIGLCEAKP